MTSTFFNLCKWEGDLIDEIKCYLEEERKTLESLISLCDSRDGKLSVLDLCSGNGRVTDYLKDCINGFGYIVGCDIADKKVREYNAQFKCYGNIWGLVCDAAFLPFKNDSFDIVVCGFQSIGNIRQESVRYEVLKEAVRVAKREVGSSGNIFFSVYSEKARSLQLNQYKKLGLEVIENDDKYFLTKEGLYSERFSKDELKAMCSKLDDICDTVIVSLTDIAYGVILKKG